MHKPIILSAVPYRGMSRKQILQRLNGGEQSRILLDRAYERHPDIDLSGSPFVFHPIAVAEKGAKLWDTGGKRIKTLVDLGVTRDDVLAVLLGHDTVEVTNPAEYEIPYEKRQLLDLGVNNLVTDGIVAFTELRIPGASRPEILHSYYQRLRCNPIADIFKPCDWEHNLERLQGLTPQQRVPRIVKYGYIMTYLHPGRPPKMPNGIYDLPYWMIQEAAGRQHEFQRAAELGFEVDLTVASRISSRQTGPRSDGLPPPNLRTAA